MESRRKYDNVRVTDEIFNRFGQAVGEYLTNQNISIGKLAKLLHCTEGSLYQMIEGVSIPRAMVIRELSTLTGVSVDYLLMLSNVKYRKEPKP